MIVLHAGLLERRLVLWGEAPVTAEAHPKKKRGRPPKVYRPEPLPYDAGIDAVVIALKKAGVCSRIKKKQAMRCVARLPAINTAPLASSPLISEPPDSRGKLQLKPWKIAVIHLTPAQAVEIVCACMGKRTLAPGVVVGEDLAFWAHALRFAGAVVACQRYLPGIEKREKSWYACWKPAYRGADLNALSSIAQAMPAVARALAPLTGDPSGISPRSLLMDFVGDVVDHLVRVSLPSQPLGMRSGTGRPGKPVSFDSIHDQWLYALHTSDGMMAGDEEELARLDGQVREWQRPALQPAASPFRLALRLEEPPVRGEEEGLFSGVHEPWYVRFLLQSIDDPSLLLPVQAAWSGEKFPGAPFAREAFNAREYLLQTLGRAAGICPHIEKGLRSGAPAGYELNPEGAYEFLTEKALMLDQAGFRVMLPAWWTRKGTKLRLTARAEVKSPSLKSSSGLSLGRVVEFNWQVALGDEKLSLDELAALAALKVPLVKFRGQWVQVDAGEIREALHYWRGKAAGQATVREIVRMAWGAVESPGGISFEGVTATGWVGRLLKQLEGRVSFEELALPEGLHGTLRPYQVKGYSWLAFLRRWELGACLADDMGLGKTVQTLTLLLRDWRENGGKPVLLVCPTSVIATWQKEAARFTPDLPVMVHHGTGRKRANALARRVKQHALVVTSYALLHRDFEDLRSVSWGGVVLDEAQNIKNPETMQARAARAIDADYRIALTGTPVENNVGDLWSIMEFLNPGLLGTQAAFKRAFFIPIQARREREAMERLRRLTGPFILRRLKTDSTIIADLPEKMEMKVYCTLTREQASLYAAVVEEVNRALESAEGIGRKGLILATLSKLKQVCNHPRQFLGDNSEVHGRSGKLARLTEMLEEIIEGDERVLIFTQFTEMGHILHDYLQEQLGREVLFLHGGVPKKKRDRMVERFQSDRDGPPIFLLSVKAGGTGLNLMRANHVFHFDRWWNPAVENQATDRAFRIGQTRNVQVHKFICAGTMEEKIDEMIERKKELAGKIVGTGEAWLTEFSTAELKELFSLRKEAVIE